MDIEVVANAYCRDSREVPAKNDVQVYLEVYPVDDPAETIGQNCLTYGV